MKLGAFLTNGDYVTLNTLIKAVRGKVYLMLHTENADKVRAMMG